MCGLKAALPSFKDEHDADEFQSYEFEESYLKNVWKLIPPYALSKISKLNLTTARPGTVQLKAGVQVKIPFYNYSFKPTTDGNYAFYFMPSHDSIVVIKPYRIEV